MMSALRFVFMFLLLWSQVSGAQQVSCESLFLSSAGSSRYAPPTAIGDSKEPVYIPQGAIRSLEQIRSQHQCQASECYLFSYVGMLEVANLNVLKRTNAPKISAPFLFAHKLIEWATDTAWNPDNASLHLKGGFFHDSIALTRKHGLVPESSWQPKVPYEQWDFVQIYNDIATIAKKQNRYIKGNILTNLFRGDRNELRKKRYFEALPAIKAAIEKWTGPLPTEVDFEGQRLKVKDLERMYGIDHRTHIEMMYPRGRFSYSNEVLKRGFDNAVSIYEGSWHYGEQGYITIENKIMEWVDKEAPVMVELNWGPNGGAHAMIIVGYEKQDGDVTRWKLQNSWGSEWSDQGSAWYTIEDLRANLRGAYFVGWEPVPAN